MAAGHRRGHGQRRLILRPRAPATHSLGIRLTAQDIADANVEATEPPRVRRVIHQVHFPVGSQTTKVLATGSRFSPGRLTRLVNKKLARS